MPRGGYRKPTNPAPVSGPGALSRRTDGGPTTQGAKYISGGKYGEGQQLMGLQQSAPMAAQPKPQVPKVAQLFSPTQLPSEPVTTGMPFGPGAGPEAITAIPPDGNQKLSSILAKMLPNDTTGDVTELYNQLLNQGM